MRWPSWLSNSDKDGDERKRPVSWNDSLNATDWEHYKDPKTILPTVLLTTTIIVGYGLYRSYLRRIPQADYISPRILRKKSLFGIATRVGDADNFHLFHTPGGRLAGWGWWRKIPEDKRELKGNTVHVRLAGIDAPEGAHFGKPAQPYSEEALKWLTNYVLGRRVRAHVYAIDRYKRVVATVFVRRYIFFRKDVGLAMLKEGYATVYEAKQGAEFGEFETQYREMEKWAKKKRRGMWAGKAEDFESPRDYKTRTANMGDQK